MYNSYMLKINTKSILIIIVLLFWPTGIILKNTYPEKFLYLIPAFLIAISFIVYSQKRSTYAIPIVLMPLIAPKFALFSLVFCISNYILQKNNLNRVLILMSILTFIYVWKPYYGQTIFVKDYESQQTVIRNTQLYDNILIARIFHNKARIIIDKYSDRFFQIIDINNYFFGFHPRQDSLNNQNITKYPYPALFFLGVGIYTVGSIKQKKHILLASLSLLFTLPFLTNYDRHDIVLWVPLTLIIVHGINRIEISKYGQLIIALSIIISLTELFHIFI